MWERDGIGEVADPCQRPALPYSCQPHSQGELPHQLAEMVVVGDVGNIWMPVWPTRRRGLGGHFQGPGPAVEFPIARVGCCRDCNRRGIIECYPGTEGGRRGGREVAPRSSRLAWR